MSSEGYSETFFKGPAYALVIGISNYQHGQDAGQPLEDNQFPNLKYAKKDAEDFAAFLKNYGFINYNVSELFDEKASRKNIIKELERLKEFCTQPETKDPLVIVYFSGHGFPDSKGRHYLIPYDAERDSLISTALSNTEFGSHLNDMKTNRRVVFIDACHAGAMAMDGAAKGGLAQYDARIGLGEGHGRYLIASCKPGQQSYEHGENGIFTGELLKLLKCETDDLAEEEIDIFPLFHALKKKVAAAAQRIGKEQEPISEMTGASGIILAINERVKKKRLQDDKEASEEKHQFLELICERIRKSDYDQKAMIATRLRAHVREEGFEGYDDLHGCFDECLKRWRQGDTSRLDEWCKLLLTAHKYASETPNAPKESRSQEPSKPVDKFVAEPVESKVIGLEESSTSRVPAPPSEPQQLRRQLTPEGCEYILEEIMTKLKYYSDARALREILSRPVSESEFAQTLNRIGLKRNDTKLEDMLQKIATRFYEWWDKSKDVEATTLSTFLMQKGKDD